VSQSVKARLAGLYFSLGDMPNAVRYADQAVEGPSQDGQLLTQMAGILASAGQGERAVKLLDRAIDLDPTSSDPYFTCLAPTKAQPEAEQLPGGLARLPPAGPHHLGRVLDAGKGRRRQFGAGDCVTPVCSSYFALASTGESRRNRSSDRSATEISPDGEPAKPRYPAPAGSALCERKGFSGRQERIE
jgi:tetratricopeptide (TPR) repeat protein